MKRQAFKFLAKVNKAILPSYSKQKLDLAKASKLQMAIIGWRWFVTKNALDQFKNKKKDFQCHESLFAINLKLFI